ncbi:hypothetical protein C7451_11236 [Blastomonas natatoria]|uniref:Superfamily III holin-X n=1 Tax=Blastomonas natatoria TaxID=34015 RepID=A0A2V3UT90_9SPHN|nr:phage holin family protein [Blastomonas natatoria]PXW71592.1 hypothetical protein C7451_11236 [Blastomonas natatoria]
MTRSNPDTTAVPDAGDIPLAPGAEPDKPGLVEQLRGLYSDGRELIDAELSFQKARVSAAGRQVRAMALLAFVGLVLVSCALIALVVGTMIALIPLIGPWGAMVATVLGALVLAVLSFWLAARRIGKLGDLFASDDDHGAGTKAAS